MHKIDIIFMQLTLFSTKSEPLGPKGLVYIGILASFSCACPHRDIVIDALIRER